MTTADGMKVCLTKKDTWWVTLATALIAWLVSSYAIEPVCNFQARFQRSLRDITFDPASPQTNFSRIHTKTAQP